MNKLSFAVVLLAVALAAQSVEGKEKAKKKPPVQVKDGSLSDQDHFHEGKHDPQYDHDAFLGEEQAREMKKLSPKETKKRLRYFEYCYSIKVNLNLLKTLLGAFMFILKSSFD